MSAGNIVVSLLANTGSFTTDINRSTKAAEKRFRELKKEAEQIGVAISTAFVAVATASAYMVKSSIDAMDEMSKLAQQTGTTVESLSALAYAADLSGVSQGELGSALVKLTKNMSDAAMGTGEAQKGFKALGISLKDANGVLKSSDQILKEVANKFQGYADGAEKTALAVNLFGRSGAQLIPLLNGGADGLDTMRAEAERLGVVLDTETSKAAEQFNDNLTRMGYAVRGLSNQAATELMPTLNSVSEMFVELAKNQSVIEVVTNVVKAAIGGLINVFQTVAVVGSDLGFVFSVIGKEIGSIGAQWAAFARGDFDQIRFIREAVKADTTAARLELDKFQRQVMAIGNTAPMDSEAMRRLGRGPSPGGGKPPPGMTGDKSSSASAYAKSQLAFDLAEMKIASDAIANTLSNSEKIIESIRAAGLIDDREYYAAKLGFIRLRSEAEERELENQIARLNEEKFVGKDAASQWLDNARKINEAQAKLAKVRENSATEKLLLDARESKKAADDLAKALEWETDARLKNLQVTMRADDAALAEVARMGEMNKALREEIEMIGADVKAQIAIEQARLSSTIAMKEQTLAVMQNNGATQVQINALTDEIRLLKERSALLGKKGTALINEDELAKAKDFAKGVEKDLASAFQAAFNSTGNPIKAFGESLASVVFNRVSTALAESLATDAINALGLGKDGVGLFSAIGAIFGGGKAGGGDVMAGKAYMIGEQGPEMFVPRTAGTVLPNSKMGGSGELHIHVGAGVNRNEVYAAVQQGVAASVGVVAESRRRGGYV